MKAKKGCRVIAEFSVHPIGEGTSVSKYVKAAVNELKKAKGIRIMTTPMATIMEAKGLPEILQAVQAAHEALFNEGARRVGFTLIVDDRRDKERQMEDKVAAVS